jgi:phage terminase large subunit GpA-like protein
MPDMTKYIIDYGRLDSFAQVRSLVYETRYPELNTNASLAMFRAAIDSGGTTGEGAYSRTEEVYEFVWRYGPPRLFAVKGAPRELGITVRFSQITKMPGRSTPIAGGIQLGLLDTGRIKQNIFYCLTDKAAKRPIKIYGVDPSIEVNELLHTELVNQLTAERQIKNIHGKLVWILHKRDNHYLDCLVMAMACGDVSWTPSVSMLAEARRLERLQAPYTGPAAAEERPKAVKERRRKW